MRKGPDGIAERLAGLALAPAEGPAQAAVLVALQALDAAAASRGNRPSAGAEGLLLLCQELLKGPLPTAEREVAEGLVTQLLSARDLQALANGQLVAASIDFQLRQLVAELCRHFESQHGTPTLGLFHPAVPGAVRGDPRRLAELLEALLRDARRQATTRLLVQVDLVGETQDRVNLRFDVVPDDPPEEPAGTEPSELAAGFASLIRGQVKEESSRGFGRALTLKAELTKQPALARAILAPAASLIGRRALVAADDPTTLTERLAQLGMLPTGTTQAPVEALGSNPEPFDVVIMSAPFRGQEGFDELRALRSDASGRDLRIVHLTWTRRRDLAKDAEQAGANAFLSQPVDDATLETCLRTLCGIRAQAHPSAGHAANLLVTGHSLREARVARTPLGLLVARPGPARDQAAEVLTRRGLWVDTVASEVEARTALEARTYAVLVAEPSLWSAPILEVLEKDGLRGRVEGPVTGLDPAELLRELGAAGRPVDFDLVPVLDATRLVQELGGLAPEALSELVSAYLRDAPQHLAALRNLAADPAAFTNSVINLEGSSLMVGALRVAVLAFELRRAGQAARWEHAERVLGGLDQELERVGRELARLTAS
jgi:CheY-like chemotaxis protein